MLCIFAFVSLYSYFTKLDIIEILDLFKYLCELLNRNII